MRVCVCVTSWFVMELIGTGRKAGGRVVIIMIILDNFPVIWWWYLVTGTGKACAAQNKFTADDPPCIIDVLVAVVEKRGLTLPLGTTVDIPMYLASGIVGGKGKGGGAMPTV